MRRTVAKNGESAQRFWGATARDYGFTECLPTGSWNFRLKNRNLVSIACRPKALLHARVGAGRLSRHNHTRASASSKIGSSVPRFIAVQPPVVTSAPELKDVIVIVV